MKGKRHTLEETIRIVREVDGGKSIREVARHDCGKWILSSVRARLGAGAKESILVADRRDIITALDPTLKPAA